MDNDTLGFYIIMENQEKKETCVHRYECPLEDCVNCVDYEDEIEE